MEPLAAASLGCALSWLRCAAHRRLLWPATISALLPRLCLRSQQDVGSSETLTFQLAHPLCRVSHIDLRPFKAWFQDDSPVYAPLSVRFRLGGLPCFDSAGRPLPKRWLVSSAAMDLLAVEAGRSGGPPGSPAAHAAEGNALWSWESPLFPVAPTDALQRFELPGAPLCVGGYLAVELIGRRQRQSADGLFYTCLSYLRAVGTPLHHFLPHSARMDRLMGWALVPYMLPDTGRRRESAPAGQAAAAFAAAAGGEEEEEEEELSAGWALAYREQDALLATGGLRAASEAGRLLHEGAEPVPPGSDDGGSDSDSDSEEGSDAGSDDRCALLRALAPFSIQVAGTAARRGAGVYTHLSHLLWADCAAVGTWTTTTSTSTAPGTWPCPTHRCRCDVGGSDCAVAVVGD